MTIRMFLCLLLLPACVWAEEESPWSLDSELLLTADSNVSRARFERDVVEDTSALGALALGWNRELGLMQAFTLRAFLEGESFQDVDTLSRRSAGVQAMHRWQHRLGYTAPFFQASLTAQTDDFDSDLRDADRYTAQAFVTQRFTDRLRGSLGLEFMATESDGVVFDQRQSRLFANLDLALSQQWAIYGTYSIAQGDTVSSAQLVFCDGSIAPDIYPLVTAADAVEKDEAFSEALCGDWLAYRLDATTQAVVFGANRGFGHHLSLDLSAQQVWVAAAGDIDYHRTQLRAGLMMRF